MNTTEVAQGGWVAAESFLSILGRADPTTWNFRGGGRLPWAAWQLEQRFRPLRETVRCSAVAWPDACPFPLVLF